MVDSIDDAIQFVENVATVRDRDRHPQWVNLERACFPESSPVASCPERPSWVRTWPAFRLGRLLCNPRRYSRSPIPVAGTCHVLFWVLVAADAAAVDVAVSFDRNYMNMEW